MIGSTRQVRVHAYAAPVDMRKGFEGLGAIVRQECGRDLLEGDLFLFVSRRRHRAKVLFFDGTGLCLFVKRLSRGRFAALWRDGTDRTIALTTTELQLFLEGSALVGRVELSPRAIEQIDLVTRVASS